MEIHAKLVTRKWGSTFRVLIHCFQTECERAGLNSKTITSVYGTWPRNLTTKQPIKFPQRQQVDFLIAET